MYSKAFSPVGVIAGSYALCVLASQIDVPAVTSLGFDCARMPEICINICWATNCANPDFPLQLSYDKPDDNVKKQRRKSAGCVLGNNKCNMNHSKDPLHRGKPYISCDEYPYASTLESDGGNQVSRCVEIKEQRYQGGRLRKLPAPSSGNPTIFTTDLQFTGGTKHKYCQPNPDCRNDGFQIQDGQVAADEKWLIQAFESSPTTSTNLKRNASPRGPRPRSYRTKSGIEILSVANYSIGQIYPRELLMDEKELEGFSYYMLDGEMFIDDEIVEMIEHTMPGNSVVDNAEIGNSTISNSTVSNLTVSNSTMSNSMMSNSTMSSSTLSTSTFSTSTMTNTTICDTTTGTSTMSGYN